MADRQAVRVARIIRWMAETNGWFQVEALSVALGVSIKKARRDLAAIEEVFKVHRYRENKCKPFSYWIEWGAAAEPRKPAADPIPAKEETQATHGG